MLNKTDSKRMRFPCSEIDKQHLTVSISIDQCILIAAEN
jgi:hypothetical protein